MSKTVLIVEDRLVQAFALKLALTRAGFNVVTAINGAEALTAMAAQKPDIVITDVIMPVMDGYELCRKIKADPRWSKIPVVIISALGETTDPDWQQRSGADFYLAKAVDQRRLIDEVQRLLSEADEPSNDGIQSK